MNRYQRGDEVPVSVQVVDPDGAPIAPDAAPTLVVYSSAFALVETLRMPPKDARNATGLFEHVIQLDGDYAAGWYSWRASWDVNGAGQVDSGHFRVLTGGDADGTVISAEFVDKLGSTHLVQQTDAEQYVFGHNPRV